MQSNKQQQKIRIMKLTPIQKNIAEQFTSLVLAGSESFYQAGKVLADAVDEHGDDILDAVHEFNPDMPVEVLERFVKVGRKEMFPMLLTSTSPGVKRLIALPPSIQEKYAKSPVPLLVLDGNGVQTINVDVRNLTPLQANQVFDKEGVRSEAAQRAFIEDLKLKNITKKKPDATPYKIRKGKVQFSTDFEFSRQELAIILSKLD